MSKMRRWTSLKRREESIKDMGAGKENIMFGMNLKVKRLNVSVTPSRKSHVRQFSRIDLFTNFIPLFVATTNVHNYIMQSGF